MGVISVGDGVSKRVELAETREALDGAVLTIALLSTRLREAEKEVKNSRTLGDNLHYWFWEAQRLRAERGNLRSGPGGEVNTSAPDSDVQNVASVDEREGFVPQSGFVPSREFPGDSGIQGGVKTGSAVKPHCDACGAVFASNGGRDHEPAPDAGEQVSDGEHRGMVEEDLLSTHHYPTAVPVHDDSSTPGQPDTAHGSNVEAGGRGGHDSGPRVDAPTTDGGVA